MAFVAFPAPAAGDAAVVKLLAQSRAALGGDALNRVKVLELDQRSTVSGLSGTARSWNEIGGRRFAEEYSLPPVTGGDGYDGNVVWNRDGSGLVWVDGGGSGRAREIGQAFAGNDTLWQPDRGGAIVTWGGTRNAAGHSYDALVVTPPQTVIPLEIWFDRTTHLPVRYVQTIGDVTTTTTVSKYRSVDGLQVPHSVSFVSTDGNRGASTVTHAVANPPSGSAQLEKPDSNVHDFSILGGQQTTVPFDLAENHVYLNVMLDGKGPYRFIFDTGGLNLIDPAVAREIGATGAGAFQGTGVGSKTESIAFADVKKLQVGNAVLKDQLFAVVPVRLGFGVGAGQKVDGLIGFEVLSRFITTFDYGARTVTLALPGASPPAGAAVVPFVLDGRQPQFPCTLDTVAAQCTLDTGSRDSITLLAPFIAAHPQVMPAKLSAVGVDGFGLGGPELGSLGRLRSLTIGSFTLPHVIADYTAQKKGAFAAPFIAANVGGGIWKRFTMTLDYRAQTMALVPNDTLDTTDQYEHAGLFLIDQGGKYVVIDARPGTPAAAAGIVRGDRIVSVDGTPASSLTLQQVRERFLEPPGTLLHLGVANKTGTTRVVDLTLSDWIP
ncbi:MAG TPA: aspartyl protease family protein [Candidatus Baltobacteraceae bacterium]|nr:aspartyl protease family protein [Candidatus Baltobacteraceae bacterium]